MAQCTSAGAHARTLQNMIDILQEEAVALESWAAGRECDRAALRLKAKLLIDLSNSGPAERELLELTAGLMLCGGNGLSRWTNVAAGYRGEYSHRIR